MSPTTTTRTAAAEPRRRGLLRSLALVGPGIVVAGSVMGSGELINTPVQAATFGFVLLWAVVLSCVIKFFLQVEIARYALVHNRTTFQALNHCPGPKWRGTNWIGLIYMAGYVVVMLPVIGILGALGGLVHSVWPLAESAAMSTRLWGVLIALLALVLLWRGLYRQLEKLVIVLVGLFSVSIAVALVLIQGTAYRITAAELGAGLTFSLGDDRQAAAFAVISLMGALGVAANELFMYPYWVLERGYARELGDPADENWPRRARRWIQTIRLDAGLSTLLGTIVTAAFFLLGAAVLFRQGVVPEGLGVVDQIASVYTETYGEWSRWIFMIGAFCTLFSTLVVVVAASGRMWADLLGSMGLIDGTNSVMVRRCHQTVQAIWLAGLVVGFLAMRSAPAELIILGHFIIGAFMTPLLMLCIVWLAFHTDRRVRMGRLSAAALIVSASIILGCVLIGLSV